MAWTDGLVVQMQGYSHVGIVVSMGAPRWVFVFITKVSHVAGWERSNLCICHTTLLCLVVRILFEVGLVHIEKRWRHVLTSYNGQKVAEEDGIWWARLSIFFA